MAENRRNEQLNIIAGLDSGIHSDFFRDQEPDEDLVAPMLGSTGIVTSMLKRNSKAFKHTQAWQGSIVEAHRRRAFAKDDADDKSNYTLQRQDDRSD